jgi:hypothetical protein
LEVVDLEQIIPPRLDHVISGSRYDRYDIAKSADDVESAQLRRRLLTLRRCGWGQEARELDPTWVC